MGFFKRVNAALCRRVHWRLPVALTEPLFPIYEQLICQHAAAQDGGIILDVGAGFLLPDALKSSFAANHKIIGMDILKSSLRKNSHVDAALVADACKSWPLADNSVDIVISRSVMEHLYDNETFAQEMFRVLKPGGVCIHVLPGKNAPFSLLNRALPNAWTKKLVAWAFPERKDELGFVAYYQSCSYPGLPRLFERQGFKIDYLRFRYYQSAYYVALFPIYLVSALYDWSMWKLGVKKLASQYLLVASKPE